MAFLGRFLTPWLSSTLLRRSCARPCVFSPKLVPAVSFLHNGIDPDGGTVVNAICDSFRRGYSWDKLCKKFDSIELDVSVIESVLLELKEPIDAKRALGFFHWSGQRKSVVHGVQSYCLVVHILVRARLLIDARALVEAVLKRSNEPDYPKFLVVDSFLGSYASAGSSPLVFDLLIQGYAKLRMVEVGFDVGCYVEDHGFSFSLITFNTLLHVAQKSDEYSLVWKIYEHMIWRRINPNEATIRTMVNVLCKEGKLQSVVDIADRIHGKRCPPSVIVNTCLVFQILEDRRVEDGLALLKMMLRKNMILDSVAYSLVVYGKIKLGSLESAMEVHKGMLNRGFNANSFVYTSFIGGYCNEGRIEEATNLFQEMEDIGLKPYSETFGLLIEGCAKTGRIKESLTYCEKTIGRGLVPSISAFNEVVRKLQNAEDVKRANELLTHLLDKGFSPDEITYSHLMTGYEKNSHNDEVLKLYYEMKHRSLSPGLSAFAALIRSLCQCGKLEDAENHLQNMKDQSINPSCDVYEALMTGYLRKGDKRRAHHFYTEMVSKGLKPS